MQSITIKNIADRIASVEKFGFAVLLKTDLYSIPLPDGSLREYHSLKIYGKEGALVYQNDYFTLKEVYDALSNIQLGMALASGTEV